MSSSNVDKIEDRAFGIIGFRLSSESKQDAEDSSPMPEYLLIHQKAAGGSFWGIPKGHAERQDKSEEDSAMRYVERRLQCSLKLFVLRDAQPKTAVHVSESF